MAAYLLGGYTAEMNGRATGIGLLEAPALRFAGTVATTAGSPSWITAHPTLDIVYAALEGDGAVRAFRRSGADSYAALGAPVEAGELVCHLVIAPDARSLIASCWGDGRVVRMTMDAAGRLSAPVIAAAARDPWAPQGDAEEPEAFDPIALLRGHGEPEDAHPEPDEGRTSRAHAAAYLPDGRVATTDPGFDLVRVWRRAATGLQPDHEVVLPRGAGPRHLVIHPSGHLLVLTEQSCEVFVLAAGPSGRWAIVSSAMASPAAALDDAGAELAASRGGEFLYAGLRGTDTIAVLRVRGSGERLDPVALVESGVRWPRHHLVAGDVLLVAGQRSDSVAELPLDPRSGVAGRARRRAEAPTPTCILPLR